MSVRMKCKECKYYKEGKCQVLEKLYSYQFSYFFAHKVNVIDGYKKPNLNGECVIIELDEF